MKERGHMLTSAEAGRRLGVTDRTVKRWVEAGKLRGFRPGKAYQIPESAVEDLLAESEVHPKAPRSVKEQLRDDPGAAVDLMESWASEGENTGIGPGSLFSTLFKLDVEIQRAEAEDRPGVIDDLAAEQDSETILRWLLVRREWAEDGHYEPLHAMSAQAAARSVERLLKA
jgi:excisionase family DNA binding protein